MPLLLFGQRATAVEAARVDAGAAALDVEATRWANEPLEEVGTRHRAVYRLCEEYPCLNGCARAKAGFTGFAARSLRKGAFK